MANSSGSSNKAWAAGNISNCSNSGAILENSEHSIAVNHWLGGVAALANVSDITLDNCNKSGDILVKIMYNEKETTIPALKAVCGPYYKWSELEKHLKSLIPEETLGSKWNNCLEHTVIKNCRN